LFTGDTLFNTGIGRYDFEPNGKKELINSLKKLQTLEGYENVYCGHGKISNYLQQQKNISTYLKFLTRHN